MVSCANRCPRRCSDLQEGIVCQDGQGCQPGCRCSEGRTSPTLWCVRVVQWEGRWDLGAGTALEGCLPCRLPGAGWWLRADWALRVYRRPGPELGPRQPAPGGLQYLHLRGRAALLHSSALPSTCPLRLEPLVSLESLQPLVWSRGAAEPLSVWAGPGWCHLPQPQSPTTWTRFPSDTELLDLARLWHTLCALAPALVPGHPCFL